MTADVVVIGGGCIGANILYHLAQAGLTNSLLLERGPLAAGPTGRSSSQLIPRSENSVIARMKWEGLQYYRGFSERTGFPVEYLQCGYLAVAPAAEGDALCADLIHLQHLGSRSELVDQTAVKQLFPALRLVQNEVALWIAEAGYTDPVGATRAVAGAATQLGARVLEFERVVSLAVENGRVTGVNTEQGRIDTACVVVAAGIWSNDLLAPLGDELPLFWHRVEVGCYRRPPEIPDHPIVGDFIHRFYFRTDHGGLTLAGVIPRLTAGVERPVGLEEVEHPDRYSERISQQTIRGLAERLTARIPAMSSAYWRRGHTCVYDVTPDWHPFVHRSEIVEGLFAAAGFSGHGFVMSPAIGRLVAKAILSSERDPDAHLLRATRFAENEPVRYAIG